MFDMVIPLLVMVPRTMRKAVTNRLAMGRMGGMKFFPFRFRFL